MNARRRPQTVTRAMLARAGSVATATGASIAVRQEAATGDVLWLVGAPGDGTPADDLAAKIGKVRW